MAEKVDEIAALLERLKIENDLNTSEFNSILLDMKTKLENMDFPELPKEGREVQEKSNRGLKGTTIGEILAARGILLEPDQVK